MEVLFTNGEGDAYSHSYPAGSNWMHMAQNFIQIVDGAGKELAVYDRSSVVCIRHG